MGKNLFDFGDESLDDEMVNSAKEKLGEKNFDDAKKLYDKYKNYSEQDLVKEFISSSRQRIKNGELSNQKLEKTVDSLNPFLTEEQRNFLKELLGKIK